MKNGYTNKNGVKLLATLAIFVMVFAAFGVVASGDSAQGSGATLSTDSIGGTPVELKEGLTVSTGNNYYVTSKINGINIGDSVTEVSIYLIKGAEVSFGTIGSGSIVKVYVAADGDVGSKPTKYLDEIGYTAQANASVKATDDIGTISLKLSNVSDATNLTGSFKVQAKDGTHDLFYVLPSVATVNLGSSAEGAEYTINHEASLADASLTINQVDAKNSIIVVPGTGTSFKVENKVTGEGSKEYTMAVSGEDIAEDFTVMEGKVTIPASVETVNGVTTDAVGSNPVTWSTFEDLADKGVLSETTYTVSGKVELRGELTLSESKTIAIPSNCELTIVPGAQLINLGTINDEGKLINHGILENGKTDGTVAASIAVGTFQNGTASETDGNVTTEAVIGTFVNYAGSEVTSTIIQNNEKSHFTNKAGTADSPIAFGGLRSNDGVLVNEGFMSMSEFTNNSEFRNEGTLKFGGTIKGAVDPVGIGTASTEIQKLVESKLVNTGSVEVEGTLSIFVDNASKGKVTIASGGVVTDGCYVAMKKEGTTESYVFWGDTLSLTMSASEITADDCIKTGYMVDADGRKEVTANTTKSQFRLTANGDEIKFNSEKKLEIGTAGSENNTSLDMYVSSIGVVSLGEDVVVNVGNSVELDGQTLKKVITLEGVAIIPSKSKITFSEGGRIILGSGAILNVYGNLENQNVDSKIDIAFPETVGSTMVYSPNADISSFVNNSAEDNAGFVNNKGVTINGAEDATASTGVVLPTAENLKTVIEQAKVIYINGDVKFSATDFADGLDLTDKTVMFKTDESTLDLTGIKVIGGTFASYTAPENTESIVGTIIIKKTTGTTTIEGTATFQGTEFSAVKVRTAFGDDKIDVGFRGVNVNATISWGSFEINGTLDLDSPADVEAISAAVAAGQKVVLRDVTLEGTGTLDISKLEIKGKVSIGENVVIDVKEGNTLRIGDSAKITGTGKIEVEKADALTIGSGAQVASGIIEATGDLETTVSSQADLVAKYDIYNTFELAGNVELADSADNVLTIGKKTIILNGHTLTIAGEVVFDETTVIGDDGENSKLVVKDDNSASLTLNKANIYATVEDYGGNITIRSALVSGWDTDSADTISVGYGNTLNMKSVNIVSGKTITVYGILNIEGTTTVNAGASIVIKAGAVANNAGTLTILGKGLEGTVDVQGTLNNNGSIVIGDNNGNAVMDVSGSVCLNEGSSVSVKVAKSADRVGENRLVGTGSVTVGAVATLTVNGTIGVKAVNLMGTLGMNGTSDNTTVHLYDGVSVSVTSVTGSISFTDSGILAADVLKDDFVTQKENVIYSDGNMVTLTNVKGVTVSESVKAGSVKIGDSNYKTYVCGMTVSGAVTAVKETTGSSVEVVMSAGLSDNGIVGASDNVSKGKVTVGDMALGKNVALSTNGKVTVSGNLTAVEEGSFIVIGDAAKDMVTVNGTITCLGFELNGKLTAAMYSIHDTEKATETYYYTTFAAAVEAAPTAYENTVTLYGTITVSSGITIAKPVVIELDASAHLKIKGAADVVIEEGAKLDGSAGKITVNGTLRVADKDTGIIEPVKGKFVYQVILTDDSDAQVVIYAGLIGVLKNAEAGQTVTLQNDAVIDEDVEIKVGVTLVVPEKITLSVGNEKSDVTVTVNGMLTVQKRASLIPAEDAKKITFVANGVISSADEDEFADFEALGAKFVMTNYASFNIDGKTYYWSNLEYAAENCHEGIIVVSGQLTAGDIVFKKDEKAASGLSVVIYTPEGAAVNTNVYATSITLVGAQLLVVDEKSKVSTTVKGASIGGDAAIVLEGVSTIYIGSEYDDVKEENHIYISGQPAGTITISAGDVEVYGWLIIFNTEGYTEEDGEVVEANAVEMIVEEGAVLTVPKDAELYTGSTEGSDVITVEGTLAVKNGTVHIVDMYLIGTMTVEGDAAYIYRSTIAGTLDVKEKTETTGAGIAYLDAVFIGDKPTTLGSNGTVIGEIKVIDGNWFYVFDGSDVSKAKINYNLAEQKNDIKTTVVNINGEDYVTIYAAGSVDVFDVLASAEIQLVGLETPDFDDGTKMYGAPTLKTEDEIPNADSVKVGKYANVYFDFELVGVYGMISQGQGVILMLNGNTIDNYRVYTNELGQYCLPVGTYKVTYEPAYGYEDKGIKVTFNGAAVTNGEITITADMKTFSLTVSDATPVDATPVAPSVPGEASSDSGEMDITDYLLIVLVVLAAILVVIVAIRMLRN